MFSGEADPITPPWHAEQLAQTLGNSLNLTFTNMGHGNSSTPCGSQILDRFIESASIKGLDTTCVNAVEPPPFWVDFSGPQTIGETFMIEVQGLSKSFGKVKAVQNVSFSAANGQITGLLGPNGAGKSTTLRMLYTLLKPDSGIARIDGFDITKSPIDVQRRIGVLSDAQGLYSRLTTRENIRYFGRLHDLNGAELEQRIDQLVGCAGYAIHCGSKNGGFLHRRTAQGCHCARPGA